MDWKCVATAGVGNQLRRYLWPEVKKWSKRIRWDIVGRKPFSQRNELLTDALQLNYGQAFCVAPEEPAKLEGAHADHLLYVFDEAKIIPPQIFDAAEGAFSGAGTDTGLSAYAIAMSTPGEPVGRFYQIQKHDPGYEHWWVRHVTTEEILAAKRMSREFMERRAKQWGIDSAIYQQKVLGNFASNDVDATIPLSWVELAMERGLDLDFDKAA